MSLPPWNTRTRKRPRRLTSVELPPRQGASTTAAAGGGGGGDFLYESHDVDSLLVGATSTERIVRPLPPMSVLATMPPPRHRGGQRQQQQGRGRRDASEDKTKMCPLLRDWLASLDGGKRADTGTGSNSGSTQSQSRREDIDEAGSRDGDGTGDDGEHDGGGDSVLANDKEVSKAATKDIEPIDDSSRSSLSREQHARYLRLSAELTKAGRHAFGHGTPKAKEFRTLEKAVTAERIKYQKAMEEFRERNAERFLLGFRGAETESASLFTEAGEWKISQYRNMRKACQVGRSSRPVRYGKCVQEISLPSLSRAPHASRSRRGGGTFDLGSYSAQIVHSTVADAVPRIQSSWLNQDRGDVAANRGRSTLRPAKRGIPPPTCPISEDAIAAKLAVEHKVDVVMTAEGFFELLTSSDESARWIIPTSNPSSSNNYIVMEEPIPKRATTREWLSRGYKESVFESVSCSGSLQKDRKEQTDDNGVVQEVYTLLTLPRSGLHDNVSGCKVLVRTTNSLLDGEGRALNIGVRLEYFHEREVTEEFTHHERSVWLAQKLLQPDSRVLAVRVDPNSSHVISVSEMSVAHALAGSGGGGAHRIGRLGGEGSMFRLPEFDAGLSFGAVADVLHAVTKLERSGECQHLLCLPGRDLLSPSTNARTTVSVHGGEGEASSQPVEKHSVSICINVDDELDEANAVYTSKVALMSCYLPWEWNNDDGKQVPYTFPLPTATV
mmetsp:Transcript_33431/g.67483  ORF Transcript_33431/g.67483 Transcript_33431/m.67483 type:complete len:724 (+) Transcript_33431:542-2713(+)